MGTTVIDVFQAVGTKNPAGGTDTPVAYNTGVSSVNVTLKSVADSKSGRVEDEVHAVAADDIGVFGPFKTDGWADANGSIHVDVSASTDVKFLVIRTAGVL